MLPRSQGRSDRKSDPRLSFKLRIRKTKRGKVEFEETVHRDRVGALAEMLRVIIPVALKHATIWNNDIARSVDSSDPRSVNTFLNSPASVSDFISNLRGDDDAMDEAAEQLIDSFRSGRQYEWPIEDEDEIALLIIAARTNDIEFEYEIKDLAV